MTIAKDKITEIFCMADDFCHIYDRFIKINGLAPKRDKSKRKYHRDSTLSDAEVITIMILFHLMGYKCLKHFYLNEVYKNMTDLFPHTVSYNRFVELERKVAVPFILFVKKCCLVACIGGQHGDDDSQDDDIGRLCGRHGRLFRFRITLLFALLFG